jgi:hypothetical protein
MRVAWAKTSKFQGAVLTTYALLTGTITPFLIIASRATLGHIIGEHVTHTAVWAGLCGGAGSILSGFLVRIRFIAS